MHRARVSTVVGKKVLAEGKWLTVIGNRSVHNGDWVWTDGRCIYGHESAGGSAPVLAKRGESGIYTLADGTASTNEKNCDGCRNFHRSVTEGFFIWGRMPHIFCRIRIRETIDSSSMRIWMPTETFLRSRAFTGWRVI